MKRFHLALATAFFAGLSVLWTWLAGKDLNWDFLNYHFYGAYAMLHGRLATDYFAGSLQSYLNPLGFVPIYAMITSGWSPLVIGVTLSLLHSGNFVLLWLITEQILPRDLEYKARACLLAVLLAFLSPLQLTTLGNTFLEPIHSLPVLGALYILVRNVGNLRYRHVAWIGLGMGIAAGLKLTNLLLLPAAVLAIEAVSSRVAIESLRRVSTYSIFALAGLLLTHGYWSYELWRGFGNPLFPLLNNIFQSPDFPLENYQDRRHLGGGWLAVFMLPFKMMEHQSFVYSENIAADVRPLALCVFLMALFGYRLVVRYRNRSAPQLGSEALAFRGILIFAAASYLAWAGFSRIGRYGYVLWLLVGPLSVATLARLPWKRAMPVLVGVALTIQLTFLSVNGNPRWSPSPWGDKWLDVRVPQSLRDEPYAYLTTATLSYSALVPYFHGGSRFANIAGQYVQPVGSKMTQRMRRFLDSDLRLKVMFAAKLDASGQLQRTLMRDVDSVLVPYGFQLSSNRCEFVEVKMDRLPDFNRGNNSDVEAVSANFAVCDVVPSPPETTRKVLGDLAEIDRVFDRVEQACHGLLAPKGMQTLKGSKGWMRTYMNSVNWLITDGARVYIRPFRSINDIDLGPIDRWKDSAQPTNCETAEPAL